MGMTPEQYLEAFVEPNRMDCHERPGDVRRAFNAAVSASHFADNYFTYFQRHDPVRVIEHKNIGEFVEFLAQKTAGSFRDIRSMSNAYKHLYNSQGPSAKYETIDSCGSIDVLELSGGGELSSVEEDFESKNHSGCGSAVFFRRRDKTKGEFLPALDAVADFFYRLIYENA